MFIHDHTIARSQGNGTTRSTFANNRGYHWCFQPQASPDRGGNRFSLATFLGTTARIGTSRINKAEHWQAETPSQFHQAGRFAIALRPGHAKIPFDTFFGCTAFFGTHNHHGLSTEPRHTANHRMVFSIVPVTSQWGEIIKQLIENSAYTRTFWVPCNLHFFPWAQFFICLP